MRRRRKRSRRCLRVLRQPLLGAACLLATGGRHPLPAKYFRRSPISDRSTDAAGRARRARSGGCRVHGVQGPIPLVGRCSGKYGGGRRPSCLLRRPLRGSRPRTGSNGRVAPRPSRRHGVCRPHRQLRGAQGSLHVSGAPRVRTYPALNGILLVAQGQRSYPSRQQRDHGSGARSRNVPVVYRLHGPSRRAA